MASVISSEQLGLYNSSLTQTGHGYGTAQLGSQGNRVYVNVNTGNLVVQQQDEVLTGLGLDNGLLRTYNSQGLLDDDNGDNWRLNVHQHVDISSLTGTVNTAGSTVKRIHSDGSEQLYTYDETAGNYVSTDGDGAHDSLNYDSTLDVYTWSSGDVGVTETYNGQGQLVSRQDEDSNTTHYSYNTDNLISQITDASGQTVEFIYEGNNITQIRTTSEGISQSRFYYGYDELDRLTSVKVDLTPDDNAISDGNVYETRYTYHDDSRRIASIVSDDGVSTQFGYTEIDGEFKLTKVIDGEGKTTNYSYHEQVVDSDYAFQQNGDGLISIEAEHYHNKVSQGGSSWLPDSTAGYSGDGALIAGPDNGRLVNEGYETDSPRLDYHVNFTEAGVHYVWVRASAPSGAGGIDDSLHVGLNGQAVASSDRIQFSQDAAWAWVRSTMDNVDATLAITETGEHTLNVWMREDGARIDKIVLTTDETYQPDGLGPDESGRFSSNTDVTNALGQTTTYRYDSQGRLIEVLSPDAGEGRLGTAYQYDADGNLIAVDDANGNATRYQYDANGNRTLMQDAAGNTVSYTYNENNQLITETTYLVRDADVSNDINEAGEPEVVRYVYDAEGHLRFSVSAQGRVSENRYNAAGQLTSSHHYLETYDLSPLTASDALTEAQLTTWLSGIHATQATRTDFSYDFRGNLSQQIAYTTLDASGSGITDGSESITTFVYDQTGRLLETIDAKNSALTSTQTVVVDESQLVAAEPYARLATDGWVASSSYYHSGTYSPSKAIDGDLSTYWHTRWGSDANPPPHHLSVDLGQVQTVSGFEYTPRQDGSYNGTIKDYNFYVSNDGSAWTQVASGQFDGSKNAQSIYFEAVDARYVRLEALSEVNGNDEWASAAALNVFHHQAAYYEVHTNDSWASIASSLYGDSQYADVLQAEMGGITLTAGLKLDVPAELTRTAINQDAVAKTIYSYDGWGRLISTTNALNEVTTVNYDDANNRIITTAANGLVQTQVFDGRGYVISQSEHDGAEALGSTTYAYDDAGRVRSETNALGQTGYYTYDEAGRLIATVDAIGAVTERRYDKAGNILETLAYSTKLTASQLTALSTTPSSQMLSIDYTALGDARHTYNVYNDANQLIYTIDAANYVTESIYDGEGQLIETIQYNDYIALPVTRSVDAINAAISADSLDRHTQYAYDADGKLTAMRDGEGYLTTYQYDGLGRQISQTRYATASTDITTLPPISGDDQTSYTFYDGQSRVTGQLDAEGYLTEYRYDVNGNQIESVRYANRTNNYVPPQDITDTTTALEADWAFDGDAVDETGNSHDGVIVGSGITFEVDSERGQVVRLSGGSDYIHIPDSDAINTAATMTARTVSVWFNADSVAAGGAKQVIYEQGGSTRGLNIYLQDGQLIVGGWNKVDTESNWTGAYLTTDVVTSGQWHHIALTLEGNDTVQAGALKAYLDGELIGDAAGSQLWSHTGDVAFGGAAENTLFSDGADGSEGGVSFSGMLDDAKLYNRALTATDIQVLASTTSTLAGDPVSQLRPASASNDAVVITEYDALNRIKTVTEQAGSESGVVQTQTSYTYDNAGNVIQTDKGLASELRTTQARYDAKGRITAQLTAKGSEALATWLAANPTATQAEIDAKIEQVWTDYGMHYQYDQAGRKVSSTNALGQTSYYYYDGAGRQIYHVNQDGEVTKNDYNAYGNLTNQYQYTGKVSTAGLTGGQVDSTLNNALSAISSEGVSSTEYRYTNRDILYRIVNNDRTTISNAIFNAFGEAVHSYAYRGDSTATSTIGVLTVTKYDNRGQVIRSTEDYQGLSRQVQTQYDAFGRVTQSEDGNGNITQFSYDKLGRTITTTDALNQTQQMSYDAFGRVLTYTDKNNQQTSTAYDDATNTVTITTQEGIYTQTITNSHGETVSVVDGNGHATQYDYDTNGQLISVTDGNGNESRTAYDNAGQVLSTFDANDVETRFSYDAAGRVLSKTIDPDGLNLTTSYRYDGQDRVVSMTDANGIVTESSYDAAGYLIATVTDPTGLNIRTEYEHDAEGNVIKLTEAADSSAERITEYRYDALARRTDTIQHLDDGTSVITRYSYDANNNVTQRVEAADTVQARTTLYVYDGNDQAVYTIDAQGYVTQSSYDANGNLIQSDAYATAIDTTGLNDAPTQADIEVLLNTSDINNRSSYARFDGDNRLVYDIDAAGYVTEYRYDANGNVTGQIRHHETITVTSATTLGDIASQLAGDTATNKDQLTTHDYDNANRLVQTSQWLSDTNLVSMQYRYDAAGNLTQTIDGRGIELAASATTQAEYDAAIAQYTTTHSYDNANRKLSQTDALGGITRTDYDANGNIIKSIDANGNEGYFYYDSLNRLVLQVDPLGYATQTAYDDAGNIISETRYATQVTGAYDVNNKPTITTSANDQVTTTTYDDLGRQVTITDANSKTETFSYDAFGNVIQYTDKNTNSFTNTYDARNQLISALSPEVWVTTNPETGVRIQTQLETTYSYDAFGNQLTETKAANLVGQSATTTYQYDALNRQTHTIAPQISVYDKTTDSFITTSPTTITTYDSAGNVIKVTDANGNSSYAYFDGANRQIATVDANGALTTNDYDKAGNLITQKAYADVLDTSTLTIDNPPSPIDVNAARQIHFTYDANNELIETRLGSDDDALDIYTPGVGYTLSTAATQYYYDANGNQIKEVDGNGNASYMLYDQAGNTIANVDALGYLTTYHYDVNGNKTQEYKYATAIDTSVLELATSVSLGERVSTMPTLTDLNPQAHSDDRVTNYTYNTLNQLTEERIADTQVTTVDDATGGITEVTADKVTTFVYDDNGNQTREEVFAEDEQGSRVGETQERDFVYDALGRKTSEISPTFTAQINANHDTATVRATTSYHYDVLGNQAITVEEGLTGTIGEIDVRDRVQTSIYDKAGNLIKTIDANNHAVTYGVDSNGNTVLQRVNQTDYQNNTTTNKSYFSYDANNQLTQIDDGLSIQGTKYNAYGDITGQGEWGVGSTASYQTFYEYDEAGRLSYTNEGNGTPRRYGYDKAGNVTLEIHSSGTALPGLETRLNEIVGAGDNVAITLNHYNARNELIKVTQPSITQTALDAYIDQIDNSYTVDSTPEPFTVGGVNVKNFSKMIVKNNIVRVVSGNPMTGYIYGVKSSINLNWNSLKGVSGTFKVNYNADIDVVEYLGTPVFSHLYHFTDIVSSVNKNVSLGATSLSFSVYTDSIKAGDGRSYLFNPLYESGITNIYNLKVTKKDSTSSSLVINRNINSSKDLPDYISQPFIGYPDGDFYSDSKTYIVQKPQFELTSQPAETASITLTIDGEDFSNELIDKNDGIWGFEIGTTSDLPNYLASGTHNYTYTAYDANGNAINGGTGNISLSDGYKTVSGTHTNTTPEPESELIELFEYSTVLSGDTAQFDEQIEKQQAYNAFGEIVSETDGNGNVTELKYNTLGQLVQKRDPEMDVWDTAAIAANTAARDNPTTTYHYNVHEDVVAVTDARGFTNSQTIEGGITQRNFNADGGVQTHHYNVFGDKVAHTNVHASDEVAQWTRYEHDNNGQITRIYNEGNGARDESFSYDELGNRLSHSQYLGALDGSNESNTSTATETYSYDARGRITSHTSFAGLTTQYGYAYLNDVTSGLAANDANIIDSGIAGWETTTTRSDGKTLTDRRDGWNRIHYHNDFGGHQFYYQYNQAGWLSAQKGDTAIAGNAQDITYSYYDNGLLHRVNDRGTNRATIYEYDGNGNQTMEAITDIADSNVATRQEYYQVTRSSYDSHNRIKTLTDPRYSIEYKYDANGNRVNIHAQYEYLFDSVVGESYKLDTPETQDYWYAYDEMNRFTITMGDNQGGTVVRGTGHEITYKKDGNRKTSTTTYADDAPYLAGKTIREEYSYNQNGYLTNTSFYEGNATESYSHTSRDVNAAGQTIRYFEYDDNNTLQSEVWNKYNADSRKEQEWSIGGDGDSSRDETLYTYAANSNDLIQTHNKHYRDDVVNQNITDTYYNYSYDYWDSAKQSTVTANTNFNDVTNTQQDTDLGQSDFHYDANGHLVQVDDTIANTFTRYTVDQHGKVLTRNRYENAAYQDVQDDGSHNYYYFGGVTVGDIGNDNSAATDYAQILAAKQQSLKGETIGPVTSADFDQNYQPIGPDYPANAPSSYTVRYEGESLSAIAQTVWGDSSLWYILAEANGLTGSETLQAGFVLTIPNVVTNIHNNSSVFRPYNPGQAIGNTLPTIPDAPAPFLHSGALGKSELRENIRTLENLKRASLLGEEGEKSLKQMRADLRTLEKQDSGGCGIATILVAVVATVVTAGVAGFVSGATTLGSAITTGFSTLASGFSFAAVAGGVAGSFAGQLVGNALGVQNGFDFKGIALAGLTAGVGAQVGQYAKNAGLLSKAAGWAGAAKYAALNSVTSQAVNIVAGEQHGFNWRSLAASSIGAGVNFQVQQADVFKNATTTLGKTAQHLASGVTQGAIRQGVGVLVKERSRISWAGVASGAVQNTAVAGVSGAFSSQTSSNAAQQVTDRVKRTQGQFTGGQAPRYGDASFHTNTHQRSGVNSNSLRPQVSQTLANGGRAEVVNSADFNGYLSLPISNVADTDVNKLLLNVATAYQENNAYLLGGLPLNHIEQQYIGVINAIEHINASNNTDAFKRDMISGVLGASAEFAKQIQGKSEQATAYKLLARAGVVGNSALRELAPSYTGPSRTTSVGQNYTISNGDGGPKVFPGHVGKDSFELRGYPLESVAGSVSYQQAQVKAFPNSFGLTPMEYQGETLYLPRNIGENNAFLNKRAEQSYVAIGDAAGAVGAVVPPLVPAMKIVEGVALVGEAYYSDDSYKVFGSYISGIHASKAGEFIARDLGVKSDYVLDITKEASTKAGEAYFDSIYNPLPEKPTYLDEE